MCLLLLSVHAAFTITDYRQKYCTAWTDRHLHSGLTNGFFFFFFYNRKEQSAADSSGSGSSSRLCASAPASRVSARPRTCCMRIVTCPGRYSEIGQETLIDKSYLQLSFTVETENNIKDYHHSYHRTGCDLLQACNKSRSRQEAQIKIVLG